MKYIVFAILCVGVTQPAFAQSLATRDSIARSAMVSRGDATYPSTLGKYPSSGSDGVSRECLREKATKKLVCHTRAGWQAIAKQIAADKSGDD